MIRKVTIKDAQAIADIYNEYVLNSVASFETVPVTVQEMRRRIEEISSQFPYYVYEDMGEVEGKLLSTWLVTRVEGALARN